MDHYLMYMGKNIFKNFVFMWLMRILWITGHYHCQVVLICHLPERRVYIIVVQRPPEVSTQPAAWTTRGDVNKKMSGIPPPARPWEEEVYQEEDKIVKREGNIMAWGRI